MLKIHKFALFKNIKFFSVIFLFLFSNEISSLSYSMIINPPPEDKPSVATILNSDKINTEYTNEYKNNTEFSLIIMDNGKKSKNQLVYFLINNNPNIDYGTANILAKYYIEEAAREGVNHDIAFCQMCLETGFLKFNGIVSHKQNNFCGLGAVSPEHKGEIFLSKRLGVIAHIQHLKAYASKKDLVGKLIDKRFGFVKRGIAPTVDHLTGKWAADKNYSNKIKNLLSRLNQIQPI
ncbi:MAG: glucosaminidase domain-containing protein [Bacteroidales bacterium]|nr:glucosaminidase domain-containing protein [Bacteroidales bacterium]